MQKLLRRSRPANTNCFFCNTDIKPSPPDPRNFQCPHCSCWNRYDGRGVIISDEAAMHQEQLNMSSYALRANYLPPASDPAYKQLLEQLPAYKESLNLRYPPLCPSCAPAIEEVLERKNQMARTSVLGGWLRQSKQQAEAERRRAHEEEKMSAFHRWKSRWSAKGLPVAQPVFGQTSFMHSLLGPPSSSGTTAVEGDDEMEWDPTYPRGRIIPQDNDEDDWIKPQRFFAREEPTGLEGLLESWNPLSEPGDQGRKTVLKSKAEALKHEGNGFGNIWGWFGGTSRKAR
ncbi:hypothetical protein FRC00_002865 [Tulasnella sp. 408]|nr:hypothetical protein FRC00_002865 [Tulasnella sp. 408]